MAALPIFGRHRVALSGIRLPPCLDSGLPGARWEQFGAALAPNLCGTCTSRRRPTTRTLRCVCVRLSAMFEMNGQPADLDVVGQLALVNYGHFTSFEVGSGRVRGFALHMARLENDCRALFGCGVPATSLRHGLKMLEAMPGRTVARVTVYDPKLMLGAPGKQPASPDVLVSTRAASEAGTLPPLRLRTVSYQRESPNIKHVGLFGPIRERRQAQLAGFDDALFLDNYSRISEGPTWNIGFYDGHSVVWPGSDVLDGVTMRLLDGMLPAVGIKSRTSGITLNEAATMLCAFATNAAFGFRIIASIDGMTFMTDHQLFNALSNAYSLVPAEPMVVDD